MSHVHVLVRFCGKLVLLILLSLYALSLYASHPGSAACQSGSPSASADPAEQPTAISDAGTQTTARDATSNKGKKGSFILTEVEPLLLLLFGLLLFSVATGIKLKLSRANRASSQYLEPLVSQSASRPETR